MPTLSNTEWDEIQVKETGEPSILFNGRFFFANGLYRDNDGSLSLRCEQVNDEARLKNQTTYWSLRYEYALADFDQTKADALQEANYSTKNKSSWIDPGYAKTMTAKLKELRDEVVRLKKIYEDISKPIREREEAQRRKDAEIESQRMEGVINYQKLIQEITL